MKQNTFSTLALVVTFILAACSSDDYTDDPIFDQEIKTELIDKSELPQWLADYVTYLEYVPEGESLPSEPSGIYRFNWSNKTFYEILSPSQSVVHDNMYLSDGTPMSRILSNYPSFTDSLKNWTIIYMLHPTHENPKNYFYPVTSRCFIDDAAAPQSLLGFEANPNEFRLFNQSCFLVNSDEQFRTIFGESAELPEIDFSKNTLIMGIFELRAGSSLKRQEICMADSIPTLQLFFEQEMILSKPIRDYGYNQVKVIIWCVYPKLPFDTIRVKTYWNNVETITRISDKDVTSPIADENFQWRLLRYYSNRNLTGLDFNIQIPGDGTIIVTTGTNTYRGKVEVSQIEVIFGFCSKGNIKIKFDDTSFSDETNPTIQYLLQNLENVTNFSYDCIHSLFLLGSNGDFYHFLLTNEWIKRYGVIN
jgi:hypothetical protein